jgi:hypothetical protein
MDAEQIIVKPYVYRLTHRATGRFYIGFRSKNVKLRRHHSDDLGVKYFTSSREITKSTFSEYDSVILGEFDTAEQAYWFEQTSIDENWTNPLLINKRNQKSYRKSFLVCSQSQRTKDKIAAAIRGRVRSEEHCRRISKAKKGVSTGKRSDECKRRMSLKSKGRKYAPQAIAAFSAGQRKRFADAGELEKLRRAREARTFETMRQRVVVVFPSGDVKLFRSAGEFADVAGMKKRVVYHLFNKFNGSTVNKGRLKGHLLWKEKAKFSLTRC